MAQVTDALLKPQAIKERKEAVQPEALRELPQAAPQSVPVDTVAPPSAKVPGMRFPGGPAMLAVLATATDSFAAASEASTAGSLMGTAGGATLGLFAGGLLCAKVFKLSNTRTWIGAGFGATAGAAI